VNKSKHAAPTAHVIDGVSGDAQIAELWSAKIENLHNHCNPNKEQGCWKMWICLSQRMILFLCQ